MIVAWPGAEVEAEVAQEEQQEEEGGKGRKGAPPPAVSPASPPGAAPALPPPPSALPPAGEQRSHSLPPMDDLQAVVHRLSLVEKKHWCFYDDSGPHQMPCGYIKPMGDHLQGTCNNSGHRTCRVWLSVGQGSTQAPGVISLVEWIGDGRHVDATTHAAMAYDIKVAYGMRPRGERPGGLAPPAGPGVVAASASATCPLLP